MTPAELRATLFSVKAATEGEARSRRYVDEVLDANGEDGAASAAELEAAVHALHLIAWLLRQP